jgi:hypothetical protein
MRFAQDLPLPALEVILRNCVVALAHWQPKGCDCFWVTVGLGGVDDAFSGGVWCLRPDSRGFPRIQRGKGVVFRELIFLRKRNKLETVICRATSSTRSWTFNDCTEVGIPGQAQCFYTWLTFLTQDFTQILSPIL